MQYIMYRRDVRHGEGHRVDDVGEPAHDARGVGAVHLVIISLVLGVLLMAIVFLVLYYSYYSITGIVVLVLGCSGSWSRPPAR